MLKFPGPSSEIEEVSGGGVIPQRAFFLTFLAGILWSVSVLAQDYVPGEVIVKMRPGARTASVMNRAGVAQALSLKKRWNTMGVDHYSVKGRDVRTLVRELEADPDIEFAEPNYYLRKTQSAPSVQTYTRNEVQSLISGGGGFSMTGAGIQAPQAWGGLSSSGTVPVIAIIDTGADIYHPALADSIWANHAEIPGNGIDDDRNGYVDDIHGWNFAGRNNMPLDGDGHGTHVAGIVRGVTQDIFEDPMGSPRVQIMVLKFLDDNGVGTTADAIAAIYYAVNNGAKVLNNSWGGGNYSQSLVQAIAFAYEHRVLFVAAAGNSGTNNDVAPLYPASYDVPNIIAVAASNDWDNLATFSNYGSRNVDVSAPGVSILSTYPSGLYTYLSGTSMATPFVSGIAGLMAYERPELPGYQMRSLLLSTADVRSQLQSRVATSARVNAASAVNGARAAVLSYDQPAYSAPSSGDRGPASAKGGGCGTVASYYDDTGQKGSGSSRGLLLLFAIPITAYLVLRRSLPRRRFARFEMPGRALGTVGGKSFEVDLSTISLGGLGFNSAMELEHGTSITMMVTSPDGRESLQVHGQVVWNKDHEYGVSFEDLTDDVRNKLLTWSRNLVKAS